ncbi:transposase [Salmonella enterica subsp. enterica serovar Virchow]|nr:hypothetical protein [Salmonella enterica subsp. enterica]EEJ6908785.1 transposase [Salmonella enterica subsp. enterica serovar Stanleyville]EEK8568199.1 transposase [Salmonella enterica subsp. enterica serovar Virchow]EHF8028732.1 transposase [Salmonella enterica subsp. enterica serovar Virchow]
MSIALVKWAKKHEVKPEVIQPGKPTQNTFTERFYYNFKTLLLSMKQENILLFCIKIYTHIKTGNPHIPRLDVSSGHD